MAKITGGLLSLGASGSIADTLTYSKWKGRPYVRQRVVPANPQSVAQQTTRGVFSNANSIWKLAPALVISPWDRFAVGQVLTGRNSFMGRWVEDNRSQADLDQMTWSPGAKGGLAPVSQVLTPGSLQITVDITEPAIPTGWSITLAAAAAIRDQDPETGVLFAITAGSDAATPFQVVLTALTASVVYQVGSWIEWLKPDGTVAYGASINGQATPTA